jgi:Holliday junction DNA helicase RuvA
MLQNMIGKLKGLVLEKSAEGAVIDVGGVGYEVALPLGTLAALPPTGKETILWIHTHVREDELRLFGFATRSDRAAFRTMLKVSGVGPKAALAVLGTLTADQLAQVVDTGETRRLTAIPGIGKKTAERIVLELGGKLGLGREQKGVVLPGSLGELNSALRNLGFKPAAVERAVREVEKTLGPERPFEVLLRHGLSQLQEK